MSFNKELVSQESQFNNEIIDLYEFWSILARRRSIVFGVFFCCLISGVGYSFFNVPTYDFVTKIEVGTIFNEPLETSLETLQKVKEIYIPEVLAGTTLNNGVGPSVNASIPKGSTYVTLTSRGSLHEGGKIELLHNAIIDLLISGHRQIMDISRTKNLKNLELQLKSARLKKDEDISFEKLLKSQVKRLGIVESLLNKQIETIEEELADVYSRRSKLQALSGDNLWIAELLIDNQIAQRSIQLANLRERLNIELANDRQKIEHELVMIRNSLALKKKEIDQMQETYLGPALNQTEGMDDHWSADYKESRALGVAVRSSQSNGLGTSVVLFLTAMLGISAGVFFAFIVETLSAAKLNVKTSLELSRF